MSQLEDQEFYLSRKIDEARVLYDELVAEKHSITARVDKLKGELSKLANEAKHTLGHIQGHKAWKTAIREVFGEDGLRLCIAQMQNAQAASNERRGEAPQAPTQNGV